MMFRKKLILAMFGATISLGLAGCGSDSDGTSATDLAALNETKADDVAQDSGAQDTGANDSVDNSTDTATISTEANSIVLTFPKTESIENMGGGIYRRVGIATVEDKDGKSVPDGTKVHFKIIDSIIAEGTISSNDGDSISDAVLLDNNPTLADGTLTTLDTAYVIRNEAYYYVEAGSHLLLKGKNESEDSSIFPNAVPEDKNRVISSEEGAVAGNTLTVTEAYSMDYPNAIYASDETDYVVGASLLGAKIIGVQEGADASVGYATTKDGDAKFYVYYPANPREINSGCVDSGIDERSRPLDSARVILVASVGADVVTLDDQFCFEPAPPYALFHEPNFVIAPGGSFVNKEVDVTLTDANEVRIPFEPVWEYDAPSTSAIKVDNVTFSSPYTDPDGRVTVFVSATASSGAKKGDSATITIRAGELPTEAASTSITITVIE